MALINYCLTKSSWFGNDKYLFLKKKLLTKNTSNPC